MNGPTMRDCADGRARCTCRPPRSTERGTTIWAMLSLAAALPGSGSFAGKKLMTGRPIDEQQIATSLAQPPSLVCLAALRGAAQRVNDGLARGAQLLVLRLLVLRWLTSPSSPS